MMINNLLFSVEQTTKIEKHIINQQKIHEFTLMENAGKAAFDIVKRNIKNYLTNIHIFCGSGNNGGDGFIVASLAAKNNIKVNCYEVGDHSKQSQVAKQAKELAIKNGVQINPFYPEIVIEEKSIIIDAILGIGVKGEVRSQQAQAIKLINQSKSRIIALDNPSGLDCDSGEILGKAIKSDITITFLTRKQGLYLKYGPKYCGQIEFSDLGINYQEYIKSLTPNYHILTNQQISQIIPKRNLDSNKGDYGHVLIVGGDHGMGGAVIMAAMACARSGAGRVTVLTREENIQPLISAMPNIMTASYNSNLDLERAIQGKTMIAIGPGLGQEKWGQDLFNFFIKSDLPKVIDADALNLISKSAKQFNLKNSILTPHPREAARLLKITTDEIQTNRQAAIKNLSKKYQTIIVLKGANSLITNLDQKIYLCPYGNPSMAVAGMGDVLTGIIAGIASQNISLDNAAIIGVYLHAMAGDYAAKKIGEIGVIPSDLIKYLGKIISSILAQSNR